MTAPIGFLSVRRHPEHGYFGGYLITNQIARPLEFHCTMPLRPSRAQELLYGPTIDEFVCGEQIAMALVTKAKIKPELVLTDCSAVLAIATVSDVAAALLNFESSDSYANFLIPRSRMTDHQELRVDRWQLSVLVNDTLVQERAERLLGGLTSNFDLTEPFQRITDALLEAHPIAKAA